MIDMTTTTAPKSSQLTADDLIGGPRTIKITKVAAEPSSDGAPIAVYFEGDGGKPYYPCKTMRRVMVFAWDKYADQYVGRSMTVWRDPAVVYGGIAVGGIRITHMSHIERDMTMALAENKKSRKPYTVKPLKEAPPPNRHSEAATQPKQDDPGPLYARAAAAIQRIQDAQPTEAACAKLEKATIPLLADLDADGRTAEREALIAKLSDLRAAIPPPVSDLDDSIPY